MDDSQIHGSIEQLVAEEHELWGREAAGHATPADSERLNSPVSLATPGSTASAALRSWGRTMQMSETPGCRALPA
jgi:hypothetical protein